MKKLIAALAVAVGVGLSSLALADEVAQPDYLMRPGDQLNVVVYNHEDLSSAPTGTDSKYIVRPDGKVMFPLIGEVKATGLTVGDFAYLLESRFKEYLVEPKISVNITKLGTTRVYVFGEVKKAGVMELDRNHNVMDAIGKAEGFTTDAAKKKVALIRYGTKDPNNIIYVNFNNLLTKGDMSQNYELNDGDALYLTGNGKINIARDIFPFISTYYYLKRADD